jgi:hypothetical protein
MSWRQALAVLALSWPLASSLPATAADIYDRDYVPPVSGSPYDDPRYADLYGRPPAPDRTRIYLDGRSPRPFYDEPLPQAEPWRDRRGYLAPLPQPRFDEPTRHVYGEPPRQYHGPRQCLERRAVRDGLAADGWHDFQDVALRGEVAVLTARRTGGDVYRLQVDRCTGEVVEARMIERQQRGYYPDRAPQRRWEY